MLCINNYAQKYIDNCRKKINVQLSAYKKLVATARKHNATLLNAAIDSFEPVFFNNMVLILDSYFTHRSRTIEGKDGNPLNEVRVLCNSMLHNNNTMSADKTIKLVPEKSVLKYKVGDVIKLSKADFSRLSKAFFAEGESKYL